MSINSLTDHGRGVGTAPTPTPSSSSAAKKDDAAKTPAANTDTTDTVDISPQARAAAQADALLNTEAPAQDFSVGSGYSSAGKTFDQVKQDMRALFDVRSDETGLEISSKTTGKEALSFLSDITDRRALFAVYGDETGTFTKAEKATAYTIMWKQREQAQFGALGISIPGNRMAESKGLIAFIDQASPEEKATFGWVEDRAGAQFLYESARRAKNLPPDPSDPYGRVETGNEKVDSLIEQLLSEMRANYSRSFDQAVALEDSQAYAQAQKDFAELLASDDAFKSPL